MEENNYGSARARFDDDSGFAISHDGIKRSLTEEEANKRIREISEELIRKLNEMNSGSSENVEQEEDEYESNRSR